MNGFFQSRGVFWAVLASPVYNLLLWTWSISCWVCCSTNRVSFPHMTSSVYLNSDVVFTLTMSITILLYYLESNHCAKVEQFPSTRHLKGSMQCESCCTTVLIMKLGVHNDLGTWAWKLVLVLTQSWQGTCFARLADTWILMSKLAHFATPFRRRTAALLYFPQILWKNYHSSAFKLSESTPGHKSSLHDDRQKVLMCPIYFWSIYKTKRLLK